MASQIAGSKAAGRKKPLPPLKAIRARCLECAQSAPDVRKCPHEPGALNACSLWPFRFGKKPSGRRESRAVRKAIRQHCVWCSGSDPQEPRRCPSVTCPLWPYRRDVRTSENPSYLTPREGRSAVCDAKTDLTARGGMICHPKPVRASEAPLSAPESPSNRVSAAQGSRRHHSAPDVPSGQGPAPTCGVTAATCRAEEQGRGQ